MIGSRPETPINDVISTIKTMTITPATGLRQYHLGAAKGVKGENPAKDGAPRKGRATAQPQGDDFQKRGVILPAGVWLGGVGSDRDSAPRGTMSATCE